MSRWWLQMWAWLTLAGLGLCFVLEGGSSSQQLTPDHRIKALVTRPDCRAVAAVPAPQGFVVDGDCQPLVHAATVIGRVPANWDDYREGLHAQRWRLTFDDFWQRAQIFVPIAVVVLALGMLSITIHARLPMRLRQVLSAIASIAFAILGACVLAWFGVVLIVLPLQEGIGSGRNAFDGLWRLLCFALVVYVYWLLARRYVPGIWQQVKRAMRTSAQG